MSAHYVYRCFGADGSLLYVGQTKNFPARMRQHKYTSFWAAEVAKARVTVHRSPEIARIVERNAIESERPRFNYQGKWKTRSWWTKADYDDYLRTLLEGGYRNLGTLRPVYASYIAKFGEAHPGAADVIAQIQVEIAERKAESDRRHEESRKRSEEIDAADRASMYQHFSQCPPCAKEGAYSDQCPELLEDIARGNLI